MIEDADILLNMGLFRRRKPSIDRAQVRRIVAASRQHRVYLPSERTKPLISSREYRLYKRFERRKLTWYEKLARLSEKILTVKPGRKTGQEASQQIAFTGLAITPGSVMSLFVLTAMGSVMIGAAITIASFLTAGGNPMYGLAVVAAGLGLCYYFYKYPANLVKKLRIKASSEVVLAVLYMVVSMRISPCTG